MMALTLSVVTTSGDGDLRSLREWLAREDDVRNYAKISAGVAPPKAGEMGTTLDVISLAIQSGFSMASLVVSVAAWLDSRRSKPIVEFSYNDKNVVLASSDEHEVRLTIQELDSDDKSNSPKS
jgi:hypothetical protein